MLNLKFAGISDPTANTEQTAVGWGASGSAVHCSAGSCDVTALESAAKLTTQNEHFTCLFVLGNVWVCPFVARPSWQDPGPTAPISASPGLGLQPMYQNLRHNRLFVFAH